MRAAAGWQAVALAEARPLRRQHARRRGHRGRQGRGARSRFGVVGQHLGRQRPGRRASTQVADAEVDALVGEYEDAYDVAPELRRGGDRHESLRYGARIELGLRAFLDEGGFGAFTTNFEDLGGLRQLPGLAVQRLMADGYGFGGEGDWKTAAAAAQRSRRWRAGLPGGTSFMEDYTYHLGPGPQRVLGAHMLEVCPTHRRRRGRAWRCTRWASAAARTRCGWSSTADAGPAVVVGLLDLGDRFRLVANEVDVVAARRAAAEAARSRTPCGSRARPARPRPSRGCSPAVRTTRC